MDLHVFLNNLGKHVLLISWPPLSLILVLSRPCLHSSGGRRQLLSNARAPASLYCNGSKLHNKAGTEPSGKENYHCLLRLAAGSSLFLHFQPDSRIYYGQTSCNVALCCESALARGICDLSQHPPMSTARVLRVHVVTLSRRSVVPLLAANSPPQARVALEARDNSSKPGSNPLMRGFITWGHMGSL